MGKDYYAILGVSRDATQEEIKQAFRRLARQYHPDMVPDPEEKKESEERFKEINEAYEVLSDPEKRARYDRFGPSQGLSSWSFQRGAPDAEMMNIMNMMNAWNKILNDLLFKNPEERNQTHLRGSDISLEIIISQKEAESGTKKIILFERRELCPRCQGSGFDKEISNVGFTIFVKYCKECRGRGILQKFRSIEVTVPPGTEDGTKIKLSGQGHKNSVEGSPGNIIITVEVKKSSFKFW